MHIQKLSVEALRNLTKVDLQLSPTLNIFHGENGSGKTSLLEAVYMLATGRSFRTHLPKRVIQHEKEHLSLFCQCEHANTEKSALGMMRDRTGDVKLRLNGKNINQMAQIAEQLPIILLNQEAFRLLQTPPKTRRQLLDWLVFHVEPQFFGLWRQFQQLLKQRNALLRQNASYEAISPWDETLAPIAEQIDKLREKTFYAWENTFKSCLANLDFSNEIKISYKSGWCREKPYKSVLETAFLRENAVQYTLFGPHRADLKIHLGSMPAGERLSLGQQKMLVAYLLISQGILLKKLTDKKPVFLIDDLPAELDETHLRKVCEQMMQLNSQLLVTTVTPEPILACLQSSNSALFHVERGNISFSKFHVEQGNVKAQQMSNTRNNQFHVKHKSPKTSES